MSNLNIQIDLTKLAGAKVMDVQGSKSTRRCVVIPIDDKTGTVVESYIGKTPEGLPTPKYFNDVKLNLVAIEYTQQKHGISHGLKPSFSREHQERMTEEQMYNTPWIGTVKPWKMVSPPRLHEDLPEAEDSNW